MNGSNKKVKYDSKLVENLNISIDKYFPHIFKIDVDFKITHAGISRLVMLDRYSQKDKSLISLNKGDLVIVSINEDSKFPARAIGNIIELDVKDKTATVALEEEFANLYTEEEAKNNYLVCDYNKLEKPLEIYWEQICKRVANNLSSIEKPDIQNEIFKNFFDQLRKLNFIPAGRVLYGAGSGSQVTYFNCFVLPFIKDSRTGISDHRKTVMEIMSRGGGVGTNGCTLRPKHSAAKAVGGKSSGAVSWLNDIANLTHLVEQGGSRRGAQMIMMADWHPDIIEFIISKMQRPDILLWLKNHSRNKLIREQASKKIKFIPLEKDEIEINEYIVNHPNEFSKHILNKAKVTLQNKGSWNVEKLDFLTGSNISITISDAFMKAVKANELWELKFPDIDNYSPEQKKIYDEKWAECGDIWEWEKMGFKTRVYKKIKAHDLWDLINFCATYSAEPGVFFIDTANKMTNAKIYGQKVVATNPCGEQPLAPYSVCNLGAINLANFVDWNTNEILYDKLKETVKYSVRMLDNVIDLTPYFLAENQKQALGERRLGLGIMGLHDLLIWNKKKYGSKEANIVVEKVMKTICVTAYLESANIAKTKGVFPYLKSKEDLFKSEFIKKLPKEVHDVIRINGLRNSHLLTIAPTGSTGTVVGVSTGLEPYYAFQFYRSGRLGKFIKVNAPIINEFLKYNPKYSEDKLPDYFVSSMQLSPEEHAYVQINIQKWVDSSISKTVNAPKGYSVKQVEKIYELLYFNGAKGGTVYVDGSRDSQVLSLTNSNNDLNDDLTKELGLEETIDDIKEYKEKHEGELRGERQGRNIGVEVGDICPICREGIVKEIGGCNTCTNCNAQLKCGL